MSVQAHVRISIHGLFRDFLSHYDSLADVRGHFGDEVVERLGERLLQRIWKGISLAVHSLLHFALGHGRNPATGGINLTIRLLLFLVRLLPRFGSLIFVGRVHLKVRLPFIHPLASLLLFARTALLNVEFLHLLLGELFDLRHRAEVLLHVTIFEVVFTHLKNGVELLLVLDLGLLSAL